MALATWAAASLGAQPVPGGYVQIQPNSVTLTVGATQQLRASVLSPLGFELPNRKLLWTSSNAAIATVDDLGVVKALAAGRATLTAKSGAALGTVSVTVNGIITPPPNVKPTVVITQPGDGATFQVTSLITFQGTANDPEDGVISGAIAWSATATEDPNATPAPLGTGASVSTGTLAAGSYLVTARATDSGGFVGVAQIGITVNPPCSVTASLTPGSGLRLPQTLTLDASGSSDSCGRPLRFFWQCGSSTSSECPNFLAQANANGNTTSVVYLTLNELDSFDIPLTVCVAGTTECAPQIIRQYNGAEVTPL